jgi:four helix bundle protein
VESCQWRVRTISQENGINSYRDLLIWQKGMALVKWGYSLTRVFPEEGRFGLVAQMRRAAISIPSNIAEGQVRHGRREFVQFFSHSEGWLAKLDTQMMLAVDLGYLRKFDPQQAFAIVGELQRMIASLPRKIMARQSQSVSDARLATSD